MLLNSVSHTNRTIVDASLFNSTDISLAKSIAFAVSTNLVINDRTIVVNASFCDPPLKESHFNSLILPHRNEFNSTETVIKNSVPIITAINLENDNGYTSY
jgi:hypothetical protein